MLPAKIDPSTLGAAPQRKAAEVSTRLLNAVRASDTGEAGRLLTELTVHCRSVDVKTLQPNWKTAIRKIPLAGKIVGTMEVSLARFDKTLATLDELKARLEGVHKTLLSDIDSLDQLSTQNAEIEMDLRECIDQGHRRLAEMKSSTESADLQSRLDARILDLELSATIRMENGAKIKVIQDCNRRIANKLESAITNTIPLWTENLALAVVQVRQREGLQIQELVDDTTNELLRVSAEMLHQDAVQTAKASARQIVDIQTLTYVQDQLIQTLREVNEIRKTEEAYRQAARVEIERITKELK